MSQQKVSGIQIDASVADLNDTTLTTPANGEVLTYQSGVWVNQPAASGAIPTFVCVNTTNFSTNFGNENTDWDWVPAIQPPGYALDVDYGDDLCVPGPGWYRVTLNCTAEPRTAGDAVTTWPETMTTYGTRLNSGFPFNTLIGKTNHTRVAQAATHTNAALGAGDRQLVVWTDDYIVRIFDTTASSSGTPRVQIGLRADSTGSPTNLIRYSLRVGITFLGGS